MVSEAEWEDIALDRLYEHGWETIHGSKLAPGGRDVPCPSRYLSCPDRRVLRPV